MASTWKIVRGVKTNKVRGDRRGRPRGPRRTVDVSPQRAKRQHSQGAEDLWTQICISVRVADLREIDDRADALGLSRSAYLVRVGLGK